MKLSALAVATALFSGAVFAAPLTLQTYNPQEKGLFAVNSTLVSGPHEAVLFDAQFSVKDGEKLVEMIRKNGKPLSRIVITSGDPDFYFGLEPLVKAFPQAEVVATPEVVKHIAATKAAKLAYWGPQMKDGAPTQVYVPQALEANSFTIDGEKVTICSRMTTRRSSGSGRTKRSSAAPAWRGVCISGPPTPRRRPVVSNGVIRWTR